MKLKITVFTLIALLLVACSTDSSPDDTNSTIEPTTTATAPTDPPSATTEPEKEKIEVDKNLLSVEITLPASMFSGQDLDQVVANAKENGVSEAKKNEDGSITYKMAKSVHNKMIEEMKNDVAEYIEELKTSADYVSIKDIKHNEKLTEFELIVEKDKFESSFDGFVAFGLGMQGMFYQFFDGVEDPEVSVDVKDEATGELIKTIVYPDAMK